MQITNEKVAFLGDSITVGHAAYPVNEFAYFALFRQKYPDAKFYNVGHSGSCIGRTHECQDEKWNQDFITRAETMPDDLDIIMVYGGTNDFGHGREPLGTLGDTDGFVSFYGAIKELYDYLTNRYPNAKIFYVTPFPRRIENDVNTHGKVLKDYVEAIKISGEKWGFPVLDLNAACGIDAQDLAVREKYLPDGLHPSIDGHRVLFEQFDKFIKENL